MGDNFIDLQINGKVFPSWFALNFKDYELPEIIKKEGEDPCDRKEESGLKRYQKFLGEYLSYGSPFKDILIYHGLGSGKTVSAINIYNTLFNYSPNWNIFICIKASLRDDPWMKDLNNWLESEGKQERFKNIVFIHYDSPFADRDFIKKSKEVDASKNYMISLMNPIIS